MSINEVFGKRAIITNEGEEFTYYKYFAEKYGYPDAAIDVDEDDKRQPLYKGQKVTILVEGEHSTYDDRKLYIIQTDSCERHIISSKGIEIIKMEPSANLDVLDIIANLARRVTALERDQSKLRAHVRVNSEDIRKLDGADVGSFQVYRKLTRDEIVKQAIEDVVELGCDLGRGGKLFHIETYVDFVVNRDKRTVVAILRDAAYGSVIRRGIAKCAPNDVFNVHIGRAIAVRRALGLEVPAEYTNAPQPTEPRVGDIVKWTNSFDDNDSEIYQIERIDGEKYWFDDGEWDELSTLTIIDDTESTEADANDRA